MNSTWYEGFEKEKKRRDEQRRIRKEYGKVHVENTKISGLGDLPSSPVPLQLSRSEPSLSNSETKKIVLEQFIERAHDHRGFRTRKVMSKIQNNYNVDTKVLDEVEFWGAKGVRGFRAYLKKKYGSILTGWRALDQDQNGRLSFFEFCNACRRMGYAGNLKKLWKELDKNLNGFVSLVEIDPIDGRMLGTFKMSLMKHYGDILTAWTQGLDPHGSGRVMEKEIKNCCETMGLDIDSSKLYNILRSGPQGKGVTLADFDVDAARRFFTTDYAGLLSKPDTEFLDDIPGSEELEKRHAVSGGALAWRVQQCAQEKAEWQKAAFEERQLRLGLENAEGFKTALIATNGSLLGAWRSVLDLDGNGRLTFGEFCQALRNLGYGGNLKGLFRELDADGKGHILFKDLDSKTDIQLSELRDKLKLRHGNMLLAWLKELDKDGTGCVNEKMFEQACKRIGFSGDACDLFRRMQPNTCRKFLTLRDFDTKAYLAFIRGDFRMISEKEGFQTKSLIHMDFDERQHSGFVHQTRRAWDTITRQEFARACGIAYPSEHAANTVEDFHQLCLRRYGSMLQAWRSCLDNDHNGKLTFNEFCAALRRLGYAGDFKALWTHFDKEKKASIALQDLDKEASELLNSFLQLLADRYGDLDQAWKIGFGRDLHDSIDEQALITACKAIGYPNDAAKLFKLLQPVKGKVITIWDLDPECTRKKARGDKAEIVVSEPKSPTHHRQEKGELLGKFEPPPSKQLAVLKPVESLRQAMRTKYGSTVAAWRAAFDPDQSSVCSNMMFQRALHDVVFHGNAKKLWGELAGEKESIRFADLDPGAMKLIKGARDNLKAGFGTLAKAWKEGFCPSIDTGCADEARFILACGTRVKNPKVLFRLMLGYIGQRSLTLADFKASLLVDLPAHLHISEWLGDLPEESSRSTSLPALPSSTVSAYSACQNPEIRAHIEQMTKEHHKKFLVIDKIDSLKHLLKHRYGSIFSAWRNFLDADRNGVVTHIEFTRACQQLGVKSIKQLWSELDVEKRGFIYLKELDPYTADALEEFGSLLRVKHGTCLQGWRKCFEEPAPANVHVNEDKFVQQCARLGFRRDARKLFKATQPEPGVQFRTYEDLWHHHGPKGICGTPGQDLP